MEYKVLALGDVASETGLQLLEKKLRAFKKEHDVRFTVVNGENISGSGLTKAQAEALFETLRASRAQIAREESVPAYIVFSNAALADMAAKAPGTMAEFLQVSGVGAVKAARYGKRFLRVIADHREKDG